MANPFPTPGWDPCPELQAGGWSQEDPTTWASFTDGIRHLLSGTACPDAIGRDWLTAFAETGSALRTLRERGSLTRGMRTVIALHVIFHWNRLGLPATSQATLARAATRACLPED